MEQTYFQVSLGNYLRFTMKSHFVWPHSILQLWQLNSRWRWRIQGPCVHGSAPGRAQWGPGEDRWNVAGFKLGNMSISWRDLPIHSWLAAWNIFHIFPFSWECHHHWRTPSFFRGVGLKPPTRFNTCRFSGGDNSDPTYRNFSRRQGDTERVENSWPRQGPFRGMGKLASKA